jgi:hypothetical protein
MQRTSVLDSFFRASSPLAIVSALRALASESAGEVRRSELFVRPDRPVEGGLFCRRIFGPAGDAPSHERRFGHITLAAALLHPRLMSLAERISGVGEPQLRALETYAAHLVEGRVEPLPDEPGDWQLLGTDALTALLGRGHDDELAAAGFTPADLLVRAVPVLPPSDRPPTRIEHPDADRWFVQFAGLHFAADNRAYQALLNGNGRLARLLELGAPLIILQGEMERLQQTFEKLLAVLGREPGDPLRSQVLPSEWVPPAEGTAPAFIGRGEVRLAGEPEPSDVGDEPVPVGCAWLAGDELVVLREGKLLVVDVRAGVVSALPAPAGYRLLGTDGRHALLEHELGAFDTGEEVLRGIAIVDLPGRRWLERWPEGLCAVTVVKDQPEDACLVDWRSFAMAAVEEDLSGDRPQEIARTPDHRFFWISSSPDDGAVMEVATGRCWLKLSAMHLPDESARVLVWPSATLDPPESCAGGAVAIARTQARWFILDCWGGVSHDGETLFRLDRPLLAAAFDRGGERLAVVDAEGLAVIRVREAQVESAFVLDASGPRLVRR